MKTGENNEVNTLRGEILKIILIKSVDELRIVRTQDHEKAIIAHISLTGNFVDYEKNNQAQKSDGSRLGHQYVQDKVNAICKSRGISYATTIIV